MRNFITDVVVNYVQSQPKFIRYKDSLTILAVTLIGIASILIPWLTEINPTVGAVVIGIVGFIATVVTRLSPGAITPSMAERLEKQAEAQEIKPAPAGDHAAPGGRLDQARHRLAQQ